MPKLANGLRAALVVALGLSTAACSFSLNAGGKKKAPPPPAKTAEPAPTPKPAAPKPRPKMGRSKMAKFAMNKEGGIELPGPVLFGTNTANLEPGSEKTMGVVVEYMNANPQITKLRVEGHTDGDDTNQKNMLLSKARAMAVSQWLIGKGVDCKRLLPVGFGEEKPIVTPEKTDVDKQQNRRVVFVPAEEKGKPIGGKPINGGAPGEEAGSPCPPAS